MITAKHVYLNGEFVAPDKATISPFDRGFMFGDGVYEVIPVFGRRLFRLKHHLQRLDRSLAEIRLANPMAFAQWESVFKRLVDENAASDQSIYLQVTRGLAPRDFTLKTAGKPSVFAYATPLGSPSADMVVNGVAVVTASDIRWLRCDIKAITLLASSMLRQQALDRGAIETLLVRDGMVTEGAASNFFIVKGGVLITPPNSGFILSGVTRDLVLELAKANGIPVREESVSVSALAGADEVWLTSSTREVLAITRIDDKPVGNGRPGPVHARMLELYKKYKQAFIEGRVE